VGADAGDWPRTARSRSPHHRTRKSASWRTAWFPAVCGNGWFRRSAAIHWHQGEGPLATLLWRSSRSPRRAAMGPHLPSSRNLGVVHFLVAGFHQPVVYKPGTKPEDIIVPATGTFINDATNRFYLGINPAGGPLNTPATPIVPGDTRSNAQNRVESVGFPASVGTGTPPSEKASQGSIW
jgi:hypothetical protein